MSDDTYKKLNHMYTNATYISRYSVDILVTAVICTVVFLIVSYYHIMNSIEPIKADWINQRCSPGVIPFAGIINKPDDQSALEFTASNFTNCTQTILSDVAENALMPLYYSMNVITELMKTLSESLNSSKSFFDKTRNNINSVTTDVFGRTLNITLPLIKMVKTIQSMFGKIQGSSTAALYTLYGSYITLNSTLLLIYDAVVTVMWVIIGIIIACFAVGWFLPPMLATGISLSAFLTVLLIPAVVMVSIMHNIFNSSGLRATPSVPQYCFDGSTILEMSDGKKVCIKNVNPGDTLQDGSIVTGTMVSTSFGMKMFKLNNIIATSNHLVYHKKKGWIKISNHPNSNYLDDYHESYVYCIGTNTKVLKIGKTLFSDWDEIDDDGIEKLRSSIKCREIMPNNFTKNDIHKYLDTGLHPDTLLCLDDGRSVSIKDIEVNDVLQFGEAVRTIVKISCNDINSFSMFKHNGEDVLCATSNIIVRINSLEGDKYLVKEKIIPPEFAYHIVTDSGVLKINGLEIGDYNKGIDKYIYYNNRRNSLDIQ